VSDVGLVIPAAGRGVRFAGSEEKALIPICGKPMLTWSLLAFDAIPLIVERVVAVPPGREPAFLERALRPYGLRERVRVVAGGGARQDSVALGVRALGPGVRWVLVHDAARPLVHRELVERVLAARGREAVVPAVPLRDSVVRCGSGDAVAGYEDRERLRLVQTPQGFDRAVLERAFARAQEQGALGTDEGSLVLSSGGTVTWVEGDAGNWKVTYPEDRDRAEAILAGREAGSSDREGDRR
jgi:2-C-methyl-D-erythritol 4-phosphate cytidylyltransferase